MTRLTALALAAALLATPALAQDLPAGLPPLGLAKACKLPKEQKILQISGGGIRFGSDPKPKESGLLGPVILKLE